MAKKVYGLLFDHLVEKINTSIGFQPGIDLVTGILDIFGFESFELNSFEQLCINYANEELQLYFNNYLFKEEGKLYKVEGIDISDLDYPDNQECVDLIAKRPTGILPSLDEECFVPNGNDAGFVSKLKKAHMKDKAFSEVKKSPQSFLVRHTPGDVIYSSEGFLGKNNDKLPPDCIDVLKVSTNAMVPAMIKPVLDAAAKAASGKRGTVVRGGRKLS